MAARPNNSNKFTSINFNDIFDKKTTSSSKPKTQNQSSTSQSSSSYKSHHGRMLLLSRSPSPAPSSPRPIHPPPVPDLGQPDEDLISLRPLGRTGPVNPTPSPTPPPLSPLPSPSKTGKFVPPHLRPGFVGKEERPEESGGRPKSGGHDRGRAPDQGLPGGRPNSSG